MPQNAGSGCETARESGRARLEFLRSGKLESRRFARFPHAGGKLAESNAAFLPGEKIAVRQREPTARASLTARERSGRKVDCPAL